MKYRNCEIFVVLCIAIFCKCYSQSTPVFMCANGRNISWYRFCDGLDDCGDNSDEEAITTNMTRQYVACGNNQTRVNKTCKLNRLQINNFVCNNIAISCVEGVTKCDARCGSHYKCMNGRCSQRRDICLEQNCNGCKEDHGFPNGIGFKCKRNGKKCVIPQQLTWDNVPDCDGNIDLCYDIKDLSKIKDNWDLRIDAYASFNNTKCFKCFDNVTIIPRTAVCDGIIDCGDLSDECLCSRNSSDVCEKVRMIGNAVTECPLNHFRCNDGKCLNKSSVCDAKSDCANSEDESFSSCGGTKECSASTTDDRKCRCPLFTSCTRKTGRACDNVEDCAPSLTTNWHGNPDDECRANCSSKLSHNFTCGIYVNTTVGVAPTPPFTCMSKGQVTLLPYTWTCDGVKNCEAGEDEAVELCQSKRFYCPVQGGRLVSIAKKFVCDMYVNCDDQSDETNCSTSTRFYCENKNPLFVPIRKIKNGVGDCTDYSDECPTKGQFNTDNIFSSSTELISSLILRIFIWIMAVCALVGNVIVIAVEIKALRNTTLYGSSLANHMLVLNLALADFLMGAYLLRLAIQTAIFSGKYCAEDLKWRSGSTCASLGVLSTLSSEASVLIMFLLTSFRLYSILNPTLSYSSPKRHTIILFLVLAWSTAFIFALLPLSKSLQNTFIEKARYTNNPFDLTRGKNLSSAKTMLFKLITFGGKTSTNYSGIENQVSNWDDIVRIGKQSTIHSEYFDNVLYFGYFGQSVCVQRYFVEKKTPAWVYSLFINIVNFTAFIYVAIAYTVVYIKATKGNFSSQHARENKKFVALQRKIMRLVVTDFCCWMPITVMAFVQISTGHLSNDAYSVAAIILLPINSVLNPILYSDLLDKILSKTKQFMGEHSISFTSRLTPKSKGYNMETLNNAKQHGSSINDGGKHVDASTSVQH